VRLYLATNAPSTKARSRWSVCEWYERGLRPGTENVALAVGLGVACDLARRTLGERPSTVVLAMGVPADEALGTVRLSVGPTTSVDEVERAAAALVRAWQSLRASS
jgi:cysteine sulfinate desulfinase/cysteine desulfurase-like protein